MQSSFFFGTDLRCSKRVKQKDRCTGRSARAGGLFASVAPADVSADADAAADASPQVTVQGLETMTP